MPDSPDDLGPVPLPPLDAGDDSDELDERAVGNLVDSLPPLPAENEGDDEALEDDDATIALDPEEQGDDDATLDVGGDGAQLLNLPEEPGGEDDSDGLTEVDAETGVVVPEEKLDRNDDAEGFEEVAEQVSMLPALVEGTDEEGIEELGELPASTRFGDEARPLPAPETWGEIAAGLDLEACSALATADGIVVAASTDLLWFAAGDLHPVRLDAGSSHIHGVALVGANFDFAVCSTASGKLMRRGRLASASEELRRIRDEIGLANRDVFDLCQPGASFPHTVVLRTSSGKLLRSDDDGLSFRRVSERKIVALGPRGPALALAHDGTLLRSDDGGGSFTELKLDGLAQRIASTKAPLLAARGDTVLLAEASVGVLLARGGEGFLRIAGTLGVTALCTGMDVDGPAAFVALYDDARDRTLLARIDLTTGTARTIATFDGTDADDDLAESARVAAIVWDEVHSRLWVAGGFGVKVLAR